MTGRRPGDPPTHLVQFYEDDEALLRPLARFAGGGLGAGDSFLAIATKEHLDELERRLSANGLDVAAAQASGRFQRFDAAATLGAILREGRPDRERFAEVVGGALRKVAARGAPVRAFGEMVALLWAEARAEAAAELEALWNDLVAELPCTGLCAYPLAGFAGASREALRRICAAHSEVVLAEDGDVPLGPAGRAVTLDRLEERTRALESALERSREVAESRSRLAAIVEGSGDAIIGKTLEGVVTSWNSAAERIFGYRAEEMIGQPTARLIPADRPDDVSAILGAIRRGERVDHYETERIRKDGTRIQVSLSVSPIRDASGGVTGAAKIVRDVTARRALEAQREQLLGVAQRARAEAEAASRSKDEFLAMLSHELRNPLAALRNAVYSARLDPGRRERALEIATHQAEQLGRLVDDLLDLSRITQGAIRLSRHRVPLNELVERAAATAYPLFEARGHRLSVSVPPEPLLCEGDPVRLEQVVGNLLDNAARYTNAGGHIELHLERCGDDAVLRVRDDGIGIAPEALPRIFELFVQAGQQPERAVGGLGIGLAVVRDLVALHRGRVEAHSEGPGRGAEFVVFLPCVGGTFRTEPDAGGESPAAPQPGGLRVLIVEDNADAAEGLMMLLEVFGHQVRVARDGPSALEAARGDPPDVMLVDIGLPGIDGYEVARRVRETPALGEVPLVALTGFGLEDDRRRALAAGFDHHLTKPVDPARLRKLLARFA
ncbi:MAG: PAS domain S-box protein [Deltaproteobacteria bacterium]|nr:PAS domain S-box protein [Deltaproteobacteria bacterium]